MDKKIMTYIDKQKSKTKSGRMIWNYLGRGLFQSLRLMILSFDLQLVTAGCAMLVAIYVTFGFGGAAFEEYFSVLPRVCAACLGIILAFIIFVMGGNLVGMIRPIKRRYIYCTLNVVMPLCKMSTLQVSNMCLLLKKLNMYALSLILVYIICTLFITVLLYIKYCKTQ